MKKRTDKLNYARWRQKAHDILQKQGEMPIYVLLSNIGYFRFAPVNVNSATQTLLMDDRFVCRHAHENDQDLMPKSRGKDKYKVMLWSVVDED